MSKNTLKIHMKELASIYRLTFMCESCKHLQSEGNNGICEKCGTQDNFQKMIARKLYTGEWEIKDVYLHK